MIDIALNHKDPLQAKFRSIWFDPKYKFWNNGNYYEDFDIRENTWDSHQFVSLNSSGEIIGYIGYQIDRGREIVSGISIINFTNDKAVFGMDAGKMLREIFDKFHFRKMNFRVVVGNPIEATYDKLISKYGGRIVGIQRKNTKLIDNHYYDEKIYEIFLEDYKKTRETAVMQIDGRKI